MGFDTGHWGGGEHFSVIADTIVTPKWHGPDPEDYKELASQLSRLNRNLLLDSVQDAGLFKAYCKSKEWAEIEDEAGEFFVIQVDEVSLSEE